MTPNGVITARARRKAGLCIANPRPVGCKLIATDGFCGYCQRLLDREPATIARRRARRALPPDEADRAMAAALGLLKTGDSS